MFNSLFGLGRVYQKLPQHRNVKELGDNLEVLAHYVLDRGSRARSAGPVTWEWRLGEDLKEAVNFLRNFVDEETNTRHWWVDERRKRVSRRASG